MADKSYQQMGHTEPQGGCFMKAFPTNDELLRLVWQMSKWGKGWQKACGAINLNAHKSLKAFSNQYNKGRTTCEIVWTHANSRPHRIHLFAIHRLFAIKTNASTSTRFRCVPHNSCRQGLLRQPLLKHNENSCYASWFYHLTISTDFVASIFWHLRMDSYTSEWVLYQHKN